MCERIALAPSECWHVCSARADAQRCWRCGKAWYEREEIETSYELHFSVLTVSRRLSDIRGRRRLAIPTFAVAVAAALITAVAMSGATLNEAVIRGDLGAVEKILRGGVSPDFSDQAHNGAHPLHRCAWRGFPEIAELLLKHGATVDPKNGMGATPLMNTAITNQPAVAKVLLSHGADKTIRNNEGQTALNIADRSGSVAVVALLDKEEL